MLFEHFDNGCDDESIMIEDFINTLAAFGYAVGNPVDNDQIE